MKSYKGYGLAPTNASCKVLLSPTGDQVARFRYSFEGGPVITSLIEGLELQYSYGSEDCAIWEIANRHRGILEKIGKSPKVG